MPQVVFGRQWLRGWLIMAIGACSLAGCNNATFPVTTDGAPTAGIERTFTGVTIKTFTARMDSVGAAALNSLIYMDFALNEVHKAEQSWQILAGADTRAIVIYLEALTPKTTVMRVEVDRGDPYFKDGPTATEIVLQTADALRSRTVTIGEAPRVEAVKPAKSR